MKFKLVIGLVFYATFLALSAPGIAKTAHLLNITAQTRFDADADALYHTLNLKRAGLSFSAFKLALTGYYALQNDHAIATKPILSVIDFTRPSTEKRLFVINLESNTLLQTTWVAHGKNSGDNMAVRFSNIPNSQMSSLGFYVTDTVYIGEHGLSLRLDGVDKGFNDRARDRAIVMHGAAYVSPDTISALGRLGKSLGCPALPMSVSSEIIRLIAGGTTLFAYYPDARYLGKSRYLNLHRAAMAYARRLPRLLADNTR